MKYLRKVLKSIFKPAAEKSSFVTVHKHGGWSADIPAIVRTPAYQQQVKALKEISQNQKLRPGMGDC